MLVAFLVAVIVFLLIVIWSLRRHREPVLRIETDASLEELIPSLVGLSHGVLIDGNSVELLENGAFFEVLLDEMAAARGSVHLENYIWEDGELSRRVAGVLVERARAGVPIRVLVDAFGSKGMADETERELQAAGCQVRRFHKGRIRQIGHQNERDHRKLCVIDGRTAFLGGHCIKDNWLGNAEDKLHYRDVSVRLKGPVVHAAQATFSENWIEESGEVFVGDDVFPPLEPAGDVAVHLARVKPSGNAAPAVRILYHLLICMARRRLYLQNPYFLPGDGAIEALGRAAERGVDVRIMVPAASVSDLPIVQHAAHANFTRLLGLGVRIFEYQKTLLHQKAITADGVWCSLGSANFDERSLGINDEIVAGFCDRRLAARLEEIFHADARHCVELELPVWDKRGFWHRCKDNAAYTMKYQI